MDALQQELFERPFWIYIALAVVELALISMWFHRRHRPLLLWMLVPVALAGVVTLMAAIVETDREEIQRITGEIAEAISANEPGRIVPYLDEQFTADIEPGLVLTRDSVERAARDILAEYKVEKVNIGRVDLTIEDGRASMEVNTKIFFSEGMYPVTWNIVWIKHPDGWRIRRVGPPRSELM
jgi:hypothetical protein